MNYEGQAIKKEKLRLLRTAYRSLEVYNRRYICNELESATYSTMVSLRAYNILTSYIDECLGDYGSYDTWAENQPWFPGFKDYPASALYGDMDWPKHYYKEALAARREWIKHMITLVKNNEL